MIASNIETICYITGAITASVFFQFLFPKAYLAKMVKVDISDEAGLFFAQHWGMMATVVGALIIYAGMNSAVREAVLWAAVVEKGALVAMIVPKLKTPIGKGMTAAMVFDTTCIIIYLLYLLG